MLYPQYFIDDLKNRADLVRIIPPYAKCKGTRVLVYLLVMFTFALACYSQEKPEARLVDSVGKTSCHDYFVRSDLFALELQNAPSSSRGIVVWYGTGDEDSRLADIYAKFMHRMLINRFGNELKVTVLRSTEKSDLQADLWIVPAGVEHPAPNATVVAEIPFKVTTRTLFAHSTGSPCSNYDEYGFAKVLLTNPDANGIIVHVWPFRSDRAEYAELTLKQLKELGISRKRVRVFFRLPRRSGSPMDDSFTEYWLVPRKN